MSRMDTRDHKKGLFMNVNSRIVPLCGVKNFRDMAGYRARDGRYMRPGRIFRSGHLSDMTEDCGTEMFARDIETVIDFRSPREKERHPVRWPNGWIPDYHAVPIGGNAAAWVKELYDRLSDSEFPAQELHDQFIKAFETIPIENAQGLKEFFNTLIDDHKGNAILFHCTAGKDRTGIAGALLMKALDIPDEQIMEDFLLTNQAVNLDATTEEIAQWISKKAGRTIKPSDVIPLAGVEPAFLQAAYASIEKHYGSLQNYFTEALGLDDTRIEKLKDIYLA